MTTQDRAPAFPFYAKDWLADPKVASMSFDNRGRYIHLLASMWEYGDEGCRIPRVVAEKMVGKPFVRDITSNGHSVLLEYERDGITYLFSNRLFNEAQKLQSRSEAARASAIEGWKKRRK